jgi:hypothetical protein
MSRDDMNELLTGAVDLATDRLAEESEFAPFALAMQTSNGEILHLEPEDGDSGDPEEIVAALVAGLRDGARDGRYRATALVTDVTLEDDGGEAIASAIHVALEHLDDQPVNCVVPYTVDQENVELDELVAEPGERVVFQEVLKN